MPAASHNFSSSDQFVRESGLMHTSAATMCCKVTKPEVKNIVVHFKLSARKKKYLKRLRRFVRNLREGKNNNDNVICKNAFSGNFVCIKLNGVSFTIFPLSGNVIGTGIKRKSHIFKCVDMFLDAIGLRGGAERTLNVLRVTNSTYSGSIECVCLDSEQITVCQALSHLQDYDIGDEADGRTGEGSSNSIINNDDDDRGYLNEWDVSFRSQFFPGIRIRHIRGGTINLFNNGKFIVVGVKSKRKVRQLRKKLCVFMRKCWMTLKEETSCAWNVDL